MAITLSSRDQALRRGPADGSRRISLLANALRDLAGNLSAPATQSVLLTELAPSAGELAILMGDRNPFVRSGAAWWFRHLGEEPPTVALTALRAAIHDGNAHVVQSALGTAGVLRLAAARDDVRAVLSDPHPGIAHSAVFALGRIGPSEEGTHILPFVGDKEPHLELAALTALQLLRYQPAVPAIIARLAACRGTARRQRCHFEIPRRCMLALVAMKATEAAGLLIEIACEEIGLRGMAVQALIDLQAREAAPALLPLLVQMLHGAQEEKLCCSLLHLMTAMDYRFAIPQVRAFLGHRLAGVRCSALRAVARFHDSEATGSVREMAHRDGSAFVRPVAVTALGDLAGTGALDDLAVLAEDANALVRAAVAEVLTRLAGQSPLCQPLLDRLAHDPAAPVARICRATRSVSSSDAASEKALLPVELREQAAAAAAFLERWRNRVGEEHGELREALEMVLRALA